MKITIDYDPEKQGIVKLDFDPLEFKTFEFISMVLGMAKNLADFNSDLGRRQGVARAQMDVAKAEDFKRRLMGN